MVKSMPLPYDYKALEPCISDVTVYTHYNKHYLGYLNKLNELLKKYNTNLSKEDMVKNIENFELEDRGDILFNLGGVLNHEFYFKGMSGKKNNIPIGKLANDINKDFGSFESFKNEFKKKANSLKGSGYTFLVKDPKTDKLLIINTSNQDTPYSYNMIPIMNIDLWEHAYYLDYMNNRKDYIDNWFNLIDFEKLEEEYEKKS